jgi:hypothetical protein
MYIMENRMDTLSRDIIRRIILQEMRPKLSSGLSFDDSEEIDLGTNIDEFPNPEYGDFGDWDNEDEDFDVGSFEHELSSVNFDDDDTEEELETEYNPAGQITGMSSDQIRRAVEDYADYLQSDQGRIESREARRRKQEAEYVKQMKQAMENRGSTGVVAYPEDPEFMESYDKTLQESVRKLIKQSIRRRLLKM